MLPGPEVSGIILKYNQGPFLCKNCWCCYTTLPVFYIDTFKVLHMYLNIGWRYLRNQKSLMAQMTDAEPVTFITHGVSGYQNGILEWWYQLWWIYFVAGTLVTWKSVKPRSYKRNGIENGMLFTWDPFGRSCKITDLSSVDLGSLTVARKNILRAFSVASSELVYTVKSVSDHWWILYTLISTYDDQGRRRMRYKWRCCLQRESVVHLFQDTQMRGWRNHTQKLKKQGRKDYMQISWNFKIEWA